MLRQALTQDVLAAGQVHPVVHPLHLAHIVNGQRLDGQAILDGQAGHIGEVIFAFGLGQGHIGEPPPKPGRVETIDATVELLDGQDLGRGHGLLDDGAHPAGSIAHHAAKPHGILCYHGKHGHRRPALLMQGHQPLQRLQAQGGHIPIEHQDALDLSLH